MKKLLILLSMFVLTGCASNCKEACVFGFGPGSDAFEVVAKHYDDRDPCQIRNKPSDYKQPMFCGAGRGKTVTVTKGIGPNSYIVNRY